MNNKLVLFDFGGVLYEIQPKHTLRRLIELSETPTALMKLSVKDVNSYPIFNEYEKGLADENDLIAALRAIFNIVSPSDDELVEAWNLTCVGPYTETQEILQKIKEIATLGLLTNTNKLHYIKFTTECFTFMRSFKHIFTSFDIGARKPEPEIFSAILDRTGFSPENILFIDDLEDNLAAARKFGIQTHHAVGPLTVSEILHTVESFTQL